MVIKKAQYTGSMAKEGGYPGDMTLPEFAFAGKSNVGKSSLINLLSGHGKLARVGKQPGKTRLIHFFNINDRFTMVDLPGYGYAKVSKAERAAWQKLMESYFSETKRLLLLFILMDIRHDPTAGDLQMVQWADHFGVPFMVIATKADKIAKSKRRQAAMQLAKKIAEGTGRTQSFDIAPVSALQKLGRDDVLDYIEACLMQNGFVAGDVAHARQSDGVEGDA